MHGVRWLVVTWTAAGWAGCQLAAHDELRRHPPRPRPAAPVAAASERGEAAGGTAATGSGAAGVGVAGAAESGTVGAAAESGAGPTPGRLDALARLRESFVASAKEIVETQAWGSIPELAARVAGQVSEVPGWHAVPAASLDAPLRETAVHALVCRALRDGAGACASADALFADGGAVCTDAVRVLQQARALRQGVSFEPAARAVGFPDDRAVVGAARAALLEGSGGDCARLGAGPGQPHGWSEALCRAVAAGDPSSCDEAAAPHRRPICRGLARALLDAAGRSSSADGPLEAMYRRWSLGGDVSPECLAEPLAVLALHPQLQAVFGTETAALVPSP